jgi:UDPglucose 6-dehydrogenase
MKSQNICVIGCGYVGLVTGTCLAEIGHKVICIDNDMNKYAALQKGEIPIYEPGLDKLVKRNVARKRLSFGRWVSEGLQEANIVFIAVGTPPRADGSADLSFIDSVAQEIAKNMKRYTVVVEKSTVPVETGEEVERTINRHKNPTVSFDMVSNPEFLCEGTAIEDFLHPDRIVIGVKTKRAEKIMRAVYAPLKAKNLLVTDLKSAELIKHASNSFLATKVSFINAVSRICEKVGADAPQVAQGMGLDPRIGRRYLSPGIGFGGFCLPKDVEAFHYISKKVGYEFELLSSVKKVNEEQRNHFVLKIEQRLGKLNRKTIGILGLAFKPHTDDIRFAPSIDIIAQLQAKGARVRAYDPVATEKARPVLKNVMLCEDPYAVARDADCLAVVTEWPQFIKLNFKRIKSLMAQPLIIDGRNCLNATALKALGFTYEGMGRVSS